MASSLCRSGQNTIAITAPTAMTLNSPFNRLAQACLPKSLFAPASGEILFSFGIKLSALNTSRCCTTLPEIAAIISTSIGIPRATISACSMCLSNSKSEVPSVRMLCALASRSRSETLMLPNEPENAESASVAPAMMNQVLTSWLLTTSPRSSASSRRFWVGSSVFSERSVSSATRQLEFDQHR